MNESESDGKGYERHEDRLRHALRFCQSVYHVTPQATTDQSAKPTRLPLTSAAKANGRSRVTLTYAQSSDGKIAGAGKKMLALSNAESMVMTHTLRLLHHGILVGIGTLCNDDPQLNARLLSPLLDGTSSIPVDWLPRPIVLDSQLQTPLECKLVKNAQAGKGRRLLVVTSKRLAETQKASALRNAGVELALVDPDPSGRLPWLAVVELLRQQFDIPSIMVEGGATVINSLFNAFDQEGKSIIDDLIITVSPMHVGDAGLGYDAPSWLTNEVRSTSSQGVAKCAFKDDLVIAWSTIASL